MKTVYLDNGATTMPGQKAAEAMDEANKNFWANPSSIHHEGIKAKEILDSARKTIANSISAKEDEIIFTAGGSEANNLAIKGYCLANKAKGNHIITTKIEHECVLQSCVWLESQGFQTTHLEVNEEGFIDLNELKSAITPKTILASIIHGNNEIGTIQNLEEIRKICKEKGIILHTDACQSYTKTKLSAQMADMITINSHKIHGPKGAGALYVKKGIKLIPMTHGGGHENNLRSGTQNVPAISGFAKAVEIANESHVQKMQALRDYFIKEALKIEDSKLNGPKGNSRLCNNVNISFAAIEGESLLAALDLDGICCSTGSACASRDLDPSHVIMAISNNDAERAHGSLRFTLSRFSTKEEVDFTLQKLAAAVEKLRKISPLKKENKN
ncbi:MAG: cysteine desulfurase family protein [Candidatus Micrarchaeota archaeon]